MSKNYLRRYTDIPALISLLSERKITLLDPESWEDQNDSHYLTLYKEKKNLQSVFALCFTQADETYHHWRVFANGSGGVCISFDRAELLKAVKKQPGVRVQEVKYLKLKEIRDKKVALSELPFLKRYPFKNENEFRMIYESLNEKLPNLDIPIPLSCITRVTLSPWLHNALSPNLKRMIRSIDGCSKLDLAKSTLISNEEWKTLGDRAQPSVARSTRKRTVV